MARIIIYDKTTLQVKAHIPSANTPEYDKRDDVLINPTIQTSAVLKYCKVSIATNEVVEMSLAEKGQVDSTELANSLPIKRAAADSLQFPLVDVIVALVKRINVRIPNNPITKQEVIDQLKADKNL